jgi:integrase
MRAETEINQKSFVVQGIIDWCEVSFGSQSPADVSRNNQILLGQAKGIYDLVQSAECHRDRIHHARNDEKIYRPLFRKSHKGRSCCVYSCAEGILFLVRGRDRQSIANEKIKMIDHKNPPLDPVSIEDVKKLISVSDTRDKAIFLTLLDTGLRAAELLALNVEDVNLITGCILVEHGKGDKVRTVYIGRQTRKALRKYIDHTGPLFLTDEGERLTYWGLRQIVRRRSEQAKIESPQIHSFRRLFALTMLRSGVDVYNLSMLMGHSDTQVLQRYLKLTEADNRQAHMLGSPVDHALGK